MPSGSNIEFLLRFLDMKQEKGLHRGETMAFINLSRQYEKGDSNESVISDSDIFDSIKRGNPKKRRTFHKILLAVAISSLVVLATSITINSQELMYANEMKNYVNILATIERGMRRHRKINLWKAKRRRVHKGMKNKNSI